MAPVGSQRIQNRPRPQPRWGGCSGRAGGVCGSVCVARGGPAHQQCRTEHLQASPPQAPSAPRCRAREPSLRAASARSFVGEASPPEFQTFALRTSWELWQRLARPCYRRAAQPVPAENGPLRDDSHPPRRRAAAGAGRLALLLALLARWSLHRVFLGRRHARAPRHVVLLLRARMLFVHDAGRRAEQPAGLPRVRAGVRHGERRCGHHLDGAVRPLVDGDRGLEIRRGMPLFRARRARSSPRLFRRAAPVRRGRAGRGGASDGGRQGARLSVAFRPLNSQFASRAAVGGPGYSF